MLLNERDPRIIVINCPGPDPRDPAATICLGDPNGGLGYAAIDQVTYGDIAGDGGNYAVIPLDSGGSIGANGSLIYRVTASPQPELVLSDGPGGAVFVDGGQVCSLSPDPQTNCSVLKSSRAHSNKPAPAVISQIRATCASRWATAHHTHPLIRTEEPKTWTMMLAPGDLSLEQAFVPCLAHWSR